MRTIKYRISGILPVTASSSEGDELPSAWSPTKRLLPIDCPNIQAIAFQSIAWESKRLLPIDCPFIQAIASGLRPSDCFSIQSIALCRFRILEFHIIDCFTVHFIALLMMLSAIPSACNTRVNKDSE